MANPTASSSSKQPTPPPAPPPAPPPDGEAPAERRTPTRRLVPVLNNREGTVQLGASRPDGVFFLVSGYNLVPEVIWEKAKTNFTIQTLLNTRIPPALAPEDNPERVGSFILVEGAPVDADNPLIDMDERDAFRFIGETFAVPLLKKLLTQETRANVLRALHDQVDKIEKPKREATAAARRG